MTTRALPGFYDVPAQVTLARPKVSRHSFRDDVAKLFKARPHEWIDGRVFAHMAGYGGWRTRISECRTDLGMVIQNRVRRGIHPDTEAEWTISEYKFVP